jgi:phosphoglucosamine mutase
VLAVIVRAGRPASESGRPFKPYPQLLKNLRYGGGQPLEAQAVKTAIREAETALGKKGRLLVRKSGTEPVIRVMAEAEDEKLVRRVVDGVAAAIEREAPVGSEAAVGKR